MTPPANTTNRRPRVLVISATVGAGHNAVAKALVDSQAAMAPEIDVECIDSLDFVPWLFRKYYAGGFALAMSLFGRLYGLGFRLTNRPHRAGRSGLERLRLWVERLMLRRLKRYLEAHRVDLIVNTHFLPAPLIGRLIRDGRLTSPQVLVVTDIEVHRWWYEQNVAHWFAPAACSAETLRRWGIDRERITVSGIATHPKWAEPLGRSEIMRRWHLPADKKIVLLSGGTEFTCGPVVRIARRLVAACGGACVVVLAGRNKKLLAKLSKLPEAGGRLIPIGFTDRLHELAEVCSLMVTKAGGVMTAECLAKAVPMVLLKPVPGQESGNAEYFARQGAAVITRKTHQVAAEVSRLLESAEDLKAMSENARRLHRPATETIVTSIRRMVSS
ncbi:MAG: hypothetical protein KAU28_01405 [Phycisphaerae bacterium]|nr:hypothetical protein [Phycisphaerae bacterium]